MPETVTVTDSASAKLRETLASERAAGPAAGLRIDVVAGGCSGHQYRLALDNQRDGDLVFEDRGVRVLVDGEHLAYVRGASVDYSAEGFRIDNPNVDYSCGCGSSFVLRS